MELQICPKLTGVSGIRDTTSKVSGSFCPMECFLHFDSFLYCWCLATEEL